MRRHTPLQKLREANQIARDHGMHVVECQTRDKAGGRRCEYVLYRDLPGGHSTRIGRRASVDGIRSLVIRAAGSTH